MFISNGHFLTGSSCTDNRGRIYFHGSANREGTSENYINSSINIFLQA